MKMRLFVVLLFLLLSLGAVSSNTSPPAQNKAALAKIAPWVLERTADKQEAEFLVVMADQADLKAADNLATKEEKGRFVYNALWNKAQATQGPILAWLKASGVEHRAYYIVNMIWVKGNLDVALALASRADVARVDGNPVIHNLMPEQEAAAPSEITAVESGVNYTHAPQVWAMGFTGQGVVVGGADTGYQWDHPALKPHYRGWNGSTASHDYNWHDSVHTGTGNPCGTNALAPCDDNSHGSHTMGTAIGDDGATNQIGMAPGAKWIGCRNMDRGNGTPATYIECFEFFLAPYPVGGTPAQGDPSKAPHVTTNSWSCPPSEGCSALTLQSAVEAQRAAGIMTVVAAGNSGSSCSTVSEPPSIYDASYTVGALNTGTDLVASFSSRGPVTLDGSNRPKPDISAPGTGTRSSVPTNSYGSKSGTSMATPHVAGAVALLWSAQPALRNQISLTEDTLNGTAVPVSVTSCSSSGSPNNVYGWGRLDIKFAVDFALNTALSPSAKFFQMNGGEDTITLNTLAGARWTAVSNVSWILITSDANGTGSGVISYAVRDNTTGSARQGTITVAGKVFTITQDGGISADCSYGVSPAAASFTANGGSGAVNVTVESRCSWEATSNVNWITITSNCCGVGNGSVNYSVAKNTTGLSRKGTITVGGNQVSIKQKAQ